MSNNPAGNPPQPPKVRFDTIGEAWRWLGEQRGQWALTIFLLFLIYFAVMFLSNLVFTGRLAGPDYGPGMPAPSGGQILGMIASK